MVDPGPTYGVRDQAVLGASSFAEALQRQAWHIPDRYNIAADIVDRWANDPERAGDTALAVLQDDDRLGRTTWRKLKELTELFGHSLAEFGIGPGQVVSVVLGQGLAAAVSHIAVYRVGAILCPISSLFSGDALAWRLRHSETRVLVTDRAGLESLGDLRASLRDLRQVIVVDDDPPEGATSFWQLLQHGRSARPRTQHPTIRLC